MKKILKCHLIMISLYFNAQGQNLVPNPSFEDTIECPIGIGNIDNAVGWSSYKLTPDYFNACNNDQAGVPANLFGYQNAKTGSAYGGLYTFSRYTNQYREVIGIQLQQSLLIGHRYYAELFASRAYNPNPGFHINVAANKLGIRFSTIPFSAGNAVPIDNSANVYTDSLIEDTLGWVRISGFFTADSSYQYLSIGNFFTDIATTSVLMDTSAALSYYYIDDVAVLDSTITGILNPGIESSIKIFPSYINDKITIEGVNIESIIVFDELGRNCIELNSASRYNIINTTKLGQGMFFIKVTTSDKSFLKIVIKE